MNRRSSYNINVTEYKCLIKIKLLWSGHSHYSRYRVWAIRHSSKSLVLCDEMQAAKTEIQRVSLSDSFISLRRYRI